MTGEEATARGYRRISNRDCMVVAGPDRGSPSPGWCDYYRRAISWDRKILAPNQFQKVPGSGHDPAGYVEAP